MKGRRICSRVRLFENHLCGTEGTTRSTTCRQQNETRHDGRPRWV